MPADTDPFALNRFVEAQHGVLAAVERELSAGRKQSHWMWFVFPQLRGLGHSEMALYYGIASRAEAVAYLAHPLLGPRLLHATDLVLAIRRKSVTEIFGSPDDLKFRSSMTLFAEAAGADSRFHEALLRYFDGKPDPLTLERLRVPS